MEDFLSRNLHGACHGFVYRGFKFQTFSLMFSLHSIFFVFFFLIARLTLSVELNVVENKTE